MSDEDNHEVQNEDKPLGRLTGKTTIHTVQAVFEDPTVEKNNYLVIYGVY